MKKRFILPIRNLKILSRLKDTIKKIPLIIGKNAFWFILIFILIDVIIGEFLFYQYFIVADSKTPPSVDIPVVFKENVLKTVLKEMEDRKTIFESLPPGSYSNPF